ncbi:MAG: threonylcarbamoyl-AMP synthase [Eubacterium sp.]|jgi:L-threonylcarbamoyladenylate synthase|nr:threonylcarbamoyl-AMP synthase [Eubacterium sp.]
METKIYKIEDCAACFRQIREAAKIIKTGGLVAFPTETVYGLGANACDPNASKKIYEAKGRPSDNPLIVHIAEFEDMYQIAEDVPAKAKLLSNAFWPGPLTIIVKKGKAVPYETTGGLDTVAVRMPAHKTALALIRESGCLIAAPSANKSGRPSPTLAAHVKEDLNGRIPLILDGGEVGIGIESTIVDLTEETPMILRPGYITADMLAEKIGTVWTDPAILTKDTSARPKAPGMKYRHYAPKADLIVIEGKKKNVIEKINALTREKQSQGRKVGVIGTDETIGYYQGDRVLTVGSGKDVDHIARNLYRILREFDEMETDVIYSESFRSFGIGQAVMNRLLKAAGHQVLMAKDNQGDTKIV